MSRGSRGCGVWTPWSRGQPFSEPAQAELYSKLWSSLLLFTTGAPPSRHMVGFDFQALWLGERVELV